MCLFVVFSFDKKAGWMKGAIFIIQNIVKLLQLKSEIISLEN